MFPPYLVDDADFITSKLRDPQSINTNFDRMVDQRSLSLPFK